MVFAVSFCVAPAVYACTTAEFQEHACNGAAYLNGSENYTPDQTYHIDPNIYNQGSQSPDGALLPDYNPGDYNGSSSQYSS